MLENSEINAMQISQSKILADGLTYFSLFDKHIPDGLTDSSSVLVYDISNYDCILKIMAKNPKAKYFVYGSKVVNEVLKGFAKAYAISFLEEILDKYNIDMKFDCIIMNPPYSKNLHLKILAEAIKHLKDEKSVCVNLSPVLWINDPHAQFKSKSNFFKFEKSILTKLNSLEDLDIKFCNELFNIGLFARLGIYSCSKNDVNLVDYHNFWKKFYTEFEIRLFNLIYQHSTHLNSVIENNCREGIRVLIATIAGNRGALPIYKDLDYVIDGYKNGKDWTKCKNNGGYEKAEGLDIPASIKFNTENNALNFYNSCKTTFYKFIAKRFLLDQHIPLQFLPWMGDSINPRTGKKGYESEWTDQDFYTFFNCTAEEQKMIEETMAKYK